MKDVHARIVQNKKIALDVYEMIVEGDFEPSNPGQFVQVETPAETAYLRRPFSIVDAYEDKMVLVYRIEGIGTIALRSLKCGETISVLGPLGSGFPLIENQKVALIGGGIGVVPLYGLGKRLVENHCDVACYMGYQDEPSIIYEDAFSKLGSFHLATMDGSKGTQGSILDAIEHLEADIIYACGPSGLLKAINNKYQDKKVYLSLEARMACGFGVCYGCVHGSKLICKDGPVFDGEDIEL